MWIIPLTTSLFYAIRRKNLKIVKNLVRMGANVNWKSPSGMTPLMAAAERMYMGSNASVTYLLYNTPMGLMQLDYSKIDLAAFDEKRRRRGCTDQRRVRIYATEDTLQKVYDLLKKEEEENSTFFGYCREQKAINDGESSIPGRETNGIKQNFILEVHHREPRRPNEASFQREFSISTIIGGAE
ncbi:hypothetical protein KQX54_015644 [Cotesia glomerata]|uniref:Uncharacterized protein n=1 Tax=Cotesia glomerata TaxID=32391 RepID=A0AAV7HV66_COTGL|nr:hypothetical protein KQX54_015644 [Cotesia glomerata]